MNPSRTVAAAFVAALFALPAALAAQEPPPKRQDPMQALRESMAGRYPLLARLRDQGKLGETQDGEVALVKDTKGSEPADPKDGKAGTLSDVVAAENKDRRALYALMAEQLKETPAEIAEQNAIRNIKKAAPDHWLLLKGRWVQKKDVEPEKK